MDISMKPIKLKEITAKMGQDRADILGLSSSRFILNQMSINAQNSINKIKKKDNPRLQTEDWQAKSYYKTNATKLLFNCKDTICRQHLSKLSVQNFLKTYQKTSTPVVIDGCAQNWEPELYWNFDYFYQKYKDKRFTIGQSTSGRNLRIQFKYYMEYIIYNKDDNPLFLIQGSLEDDEDLQQIIQKYQIPPYFREDLLKYAGERYRPPFRWLQIGPERSGTFINVDSLNTSIWTTTLVGYKRWVMFPPTIPKFIAKGKSFKQKDTADSPINYFMNILPKIIQKQGRQRLGIIEFIQNPGQTVFIPSGWWYAFINLEDTLSITQNMMTNQNFDNVWRALRSKRKRFAQHFLLLLRKNEFTLYHRAQKLNKDDKYQMGKKYERQEVDLSFTSSEKSSSSSFSYSAVSYSRSSKRSNSENSRDYESRSREKIRKQRSYSENGIKISEQ